MRDRAHQALFAYTTLLMGAHTRADKPLPEAYDIRARRGGSPRLRAVADEVGATPNQVVLAWLLGGQGPTIPIVGATSVAQLEEALGAVDVKLDDEQHARLDAAT